MAWKRRTQRRKEATGLLLRTIYREGPVSRAELGERLNLTSPAITSLLSPLIDSGLLSSSLLSSSIAGRSKQLIDFVPSRFYTIGIDAGPDATYGYIGDIRGRMVISQDFPVCPRDYPAAVGYIADIVRVLLERSGLEAEQIAGVGIGTPGFVDSTNGFVRHSTMYDWGNVWLADDVKAITSLPCLVENNARCRALSLCMVEDRSLPEIFSYLYVAKGICAPLRISGRVFPASMQASGEIGHMIMEKNGPECPTCSHRGCLEALASERAIVERCRDLAASGAVTAFPSTGETDITDVLEAARAGDKAVQGILDNSMEYLGLALSNMINMINPGLVLIEGTLFQEERNKLTMLQTMNENLFAVDITDVDIKFVEVDALRAARGAASKAVERYVIDGEPVFA